MPAAYEIEKLLHAPLEDVLLKVYPAMFLRWLYDVSLRQLAQAFPDALPPPDRTQMSGADRTPRKAYLIELLRLVLRDCQLGRGLFEALPAATREVLAAATWERELNLAAIERTLGQSVAAVNPDKRRIYYEPFILAPEHGFLIIRENRDASWQYRSLSARQDPRKEDYYLVLPDEVRKAFKSLVPPPPGYALSPLDDLPKGAELHYTCAEHAVTDLRLVAEYIAQGHLTYTKAERVALPSLKALRHMTGGSEFFAGSEDSNLLLLRTRLLAGGVAFASDKQRETLLARAESAEPIRDLIEKTLANAAFLHEELLDHLANRHNRWSQYNAASTKKLAAFFGKLPSGKWVSWENIRSYHSLREVVPTLFGDRNDGLQAHAIKGQETWSAYTMVAHYNAFELIGEPLLKGCAFLLAALGLAEIAYAPPRHPAYHQPKKPYLTPYDGLRAVRLTPLGEYVFRQRDTCESALGASHRPTILLDPNRLLATCRNPDALTELALDQFMEKLVAGRYQMTPKSLVRGCGSREDLEERIRLFRRVVSPKPPPIWESFFEKTLARVAPLELEPDYVVMKVGEEDELRRLLASDPTLRECVLKVEGLRIAVRRSDLKKLGKRLEQFGYLSPLRRLTAGLG